MVTTNRQRPEPNSDGRHLGAAPRAKVAESEPQSQNHAGRMYGIDSRVFRWMAEMWTGVSRVHFCLVFDLESICSSQWHFLYRYDYSYLVKSMADTVISQWQNV